MKGLITTKAEQYLEVLLDIVDMLPDYEKENLDNAVSRKLGKKEVYEMGVGGRIGYLISETRADIYDYEVKHSGNGKMLSLAKKVLKRARRYANTTFHYAHKEGDYTYFTDSTMLIKTPQELKSLEAPDEQEKACDFDFEAVISRCSREKYRHLVLPKLSKLKTLYKLEKAKFKSGEPPHGKKFTFHYDFGDDLPIIDGEKLIEIMDAIPDIELYSNQAGARGVLYGMSASGMEEIVLCPLRKAGGDEEQRYNGRYTIEDVENVISK